MARKHIVALFLLILFIASFGRVFPKIPVTETFGSIGCGACRAFYSEMTAAYPPYRDSIAVVISIIGITPDEAFRMAYYGLFYDIGGVPWSAVDGSDADHWVASSVLDNAIGIIHDTPISPIGLNLVYCNHDSIVVEIYTDSASCAGEWKLIALMVKDSVELGDLIVDRVCTGIMTPGTGESINIEAGVPFYWSGTFEIPDEDDPNLYDAVFFLQEPDGTLIVNGYQTSMRPRLPFDFEAKQYQWRWLISSGEIFSTQIMLKNWGLEDDTYHLQLVSDAPAGWEFYFNLVGEPVCADISVPAFSDTMLNVVFVAPSQGIGDFMLIAHSDSIPDRADTLKFNVNADIDYLLVCDSPTPDDSILYKDAMDALDVQYVFWFTQRDGELNNVADVGAQRIVWFCGEDTLQNIQGNERIALDEFLSEGGELLLTGSGIGRANPAAFLFFSDGLGAHFDSTAVNFSNVSAVSLPPFTGFYGSIADITSAEVISGVESSGGYTVLNYNDGASAAVAKADESRSIIIGFPMERLTGHGFASLFERCWQFLNEGWSSIPGAQKPQSLSLTAFPNPFNSSIAIIISGQTSLSAKTNEQVRMPILPCEIEICDLRGNVVADGALQLAADGTGTFIWTPIENTPSGIYFVRVQIEDQRAISRRIVYLK